MTLSQKETNEINKLKAQEQCCVEKYNKYAKQAKDEVLVDLFKTIEKDEKMHCDSLEKVLNGTVPTCKCDENAGKNYAPKASYEKKSTAGDKEHDCYLATDCIGTEKLVSGEYNNGVFAFADSGVRKLLADIQVQEQNHAEMLYKYKTVNGMAD